MARNSRDLDAALHRRALRRALPDGLVVMAGGTPVPRNDDVDHVFRQRSSFAYLAPVHEPGYHLVLDPRRGQDTLFIPKVDAQHRLWRGAVPGPREAGRLFGFGRVRRAPGLPAFLRKARKGYRACYCDKTAWRLWRKQLKGLRPRPEALRLALQTLRAVKTPAEVDCVRRANAASAEGFLACMAAARPGMREYELQAEFERATARLGLRHLAFPTIVAGGRNAAVLHYHANDNVLGAGDLVLVDAGGEDRGYGADISRTFPVSGRFTGRQRGIYSLVLETQKACIARLRAGVASGDIHLLAMRLIARGLKDEGILRGETDGLVTSGAVRMFFPHGIGHMLGLDVHDSPGGRRRQLPSPGYVKLRFNTVLEPGFIVTVEPGVYFNPALLDDPALRRKHRGQVDFELARAFLGVGGVRIEDDLLVAREGPPVNLTDVPKEPGDVEAACGRGPRAGRG